MACEPECGGDCFYRCAVRVCRLFEPVISADHRHRQSVFKAGACKVSAGRVFELLEEKNTEEAGEPAKERALGRVEFRDVSFAYQEGEEVLKHISFTAQKGETVALVGHTGSGKSSILNLLFRFYDAQKGDVLIDGKSIYNMSRQELRSHMVLCFRTRTYSRAQSDLT